MAIGYGGGGGGGGGLRDLGLLGQAESPFGSPLQEEAYRRMLAETQMRNGYVQMIAAQSAFRANSGPDVENKPRSALLLLLKMV